MEEFAMIQKQLIEKLASLGYGRDDLKKFIDYPFHSELLESLRGERVMKIDMFSCRVHDIDYSPDLQEAIKSMGGNLQLDEKVLKKMPTQKVGNGKEVFFMNVDGVMLGEKLMRELGIRKLLPCDPRTLLEINRSNPLFASYYTNFTFWIDVDMTQSYPQWPYICFSNKNQTQSITVGYCSGWSGDMWVACVPREE